MTTIYKVPRKSWWSVLYLLTALALLVSAPQAHAFNSILNNFNNTYAGSSTGANANCAVCHRSTGGTGGGLNEYGQQLKQANLNFAAIEGLPSANVNGGTSMLDEINASTQPGWTTGANNNIYDFNDNLLASNGSPPGGIAGDLDPAASNIPPTADANGPYSGTAGTAVAFDGTGSSDPDGTIVSYAWTFGDGGSGTGATPNHTYASAGTYTVTLVVTDDAGDSSAPSNSTATIAAVPQAPTADANGPYNGTAGQQVTFDGSGSSDPDGIIVSYDWDFGDGNTGTGVAPVNTYAAAGTYVVGLTVTDNDGLTGSATSSATIVPAPEDPIADPNGPYTGTVGIAVVFDGSGSFDPDGGNITAYDWDFGDGNNGTGVAPNHTYAAVGTYTVTLTVVDDEGASSAPVSTTADISPVPNEPPVSDPNGPYTGTAGQPVDFDGTGSTDPDGTIVSYAWDFGDGNTGTGTNPTNTYAAAGSYTVTLTVTDDAGDTGVASSTAEIVAAPADPIADPNGPYTGIEGQPVSFDGSGSNDPDGGTITAYDWDFGDGNTGTGVAPDHAYTTAGSYTVTLTVVDDEGAVSAPETTTATITAPPPNVPPTADPNGPYTGTTGQPVSFDGSGSTDPDGSIVSYDWDFGDGNTDSGVSPTHTYAAAGDYDVSLTVTDDAGDTDTAATTAAISPAPACAGLTVSAEWKTKGNGQLVVSGAGVSDGSFVLTNANDPAQTIATKNGKKGTFSFKVNGKKLNPVPCRVEVNQPDVQLCGQADVVNAPADCAPIAP